MGLDKGGTTIYKIIYSNYFVNSDITQKLDRSSLDYILTQQVGHNRLVSEP